MDERKWESYLDRRLRYCGWLVVITLALVIGVGVLNLCGVRLPLPADSPLRNQR